MRIVFADTDQDISEYEAKKQDLKYLFQIAEKLSDTEFDKIELAIDKFPQENEIHSK